MHFASRAPCFAYHILSLHAYLVFARMLMACVLVKVEEHWY